MDSPSGGDSTLTRCPGVYRPSHCASVPRGGRARTPVAPLIESSRGEHDLRMEQRPCDSGSDGDQLALAVEDLYLWSARHFRQIHGAAAADQGGVLFISRDAWQLGDQLSGMDKQRLSSSLLHRGF